MENDRTIVTFLDMLGFSNLIKKNSETAYLNIADVAHRIKIKYDDQIKTEKGLDSCKNPQLIQKHSQFSAINTFEHCIIFSDSVVIGASAKNAALFMEQLSRLLVDIVGDGLSNIKGGIPSDIDSVPNKRSRYLDEDGMIRNHDAYPILFRGGLSVGERSKLLFQPVFQIEEKNISQGLSIIGVPYVEAIRLEKSGKGPRLFCSSQLAQILQEQLGKEAPIMKKVDEDINGNICEFIWTYYAVKQNQPKNCPEKDIDNAIHNFLIPALNLAGYYWKEGAVAAHYLEFIKLIWEGIMLYAQINKIPEEKIKAIKEKMTKCWYKNMIEPSLSEKI